MKPNPTPITSRRRRLTLALSVLALAAAPHAAAQAPTWTAVSHRYKPVYDAVAVGNRGLQYQMVVAWNQGTSDPTKRGWVVTGQDENGVRLSTDYGATWTNPRLAGAFCSRMAGLYLNTDDDIFVALGDAFGNTESIPGYAGLYVGASNMLSAKRQVIAHPEDSGAEAFTRVMNGAQSDRNMNYIARRPQNSAGTLTHAQRPIYVLEQERENLTSEVISRIYVWSSTDNGASWSMVRKLAPITGKPITTYTNGGADGIFFIQVAPNGDVLLVGQTGVFRSTDGFASDPTKIYPASGNAVVSSAAFYGGSSTTPSGARIGVDAASSSGGVWQTSDIRSPSFAKPVGAGSQPNAGLPANYRVWHLGSSPLNPDRIAVATSGNPNQSSTAPYLSTDGGANFTIIADNNGSGDEQKRYEIRTTNAHGHAGFYFSPTDELKVLTPTAQTMSRSIDGAVTTHGDLVSGFDGMHAKGVVGFSATDHLKQARLTQDSGINVSLDGMHWVRPSGISYNTTYGVGGHATIGAAINAAGGGNSGGWSGAGAIFGTASGKNRIVAFNNRGGGSGQPNIPVVMDDPDGDGDYTEDPTNNLLVKIYSPSKKTRAVHGRPSPKEANVAFVGRWCISDLNASTPGGVTFTDRWQSGSPREFIACFLNGSTLVSYWGNFQSGSSADQKNGSEIYRSTADRADSGLGTAWYTIPGGHRYPSAAICADPFDDERILYVRTDNEHEIREVKRVSGNLVDSVLVNLRTMTDGLLDTVRNEVGDSNLPVPDMPIEGILADPNKSGVFYAIVGRHGVPNWWRTVDNGTTWTNISNNAPRTSWRGAIHPLTGELLGFSSMGEHVHKSPTGIGYPNLTNKDAFTAQIETYKALRPSISTTTLPDAYVGTAYSQTLAATGGSGAKVWSLTSGTLPAGLSLSSGGVISGTPTTAQTRTFDVTVADSDGDTGHKDEDIQTLTIVVVANSIPNITTASLPNGTVGATYSQTLAATSGDGALVWSLALGSLPSGLSLSGGGVISGTPTTAATSNFTVRVADSDGNVGAGDEDTQALSIQITSAAIGIFAANQDIGSPGLAGSASYDSGSGVYTVTGGGTDIYGTSDKFRFVHEPWTGDGRIIARVTAVENTHAWAKAGIMFRESTDPDSKNVDLILSATNGTQFLYRTTTGGSTSYNVVVSGISAPYWLRLERHGNTFTGWQSPDGLAWFLTDATTFSMNSVARVGLAVTAHNDADLNTSTFDNVSLVNPPTWTGVDIGSVNTTGTNTVDYATDIYTISGSGSNIWSTADSFRFYYQALTGDVTIIAQVNTVENTHANAKGGVMIRQSITDSASPHALINMMGDGGVEFLRRTTSGGSTSRNHTASVGFTRFLKLVRSGNSFTAFHSADAGTWTQLGSAVTISMSGTIYVGLASCSIINTSNLSTSTFESVFVK